MKIVIVGGVAGGASAAARLRRLDETAEIVMLERGKYISYANCGLPYYIGETITNRSALTLQTPESFRCRFNVDVRTQHEAVALDTKKKQITIKNLITQDSYQETYDILILSPGAESVIPPFAETDDQRIFTLRTIPDCYRIHNYIQEHHPKSAVIVGGGAIGLEMAENLQNHGIAVTVAEYTGHVVGWLDAEMAADVHHYLRKSGVRLLLHTGVDKIHSGKNCLRLDLTEGSISCDMVILSVGVRPDTKLAADAGLQVDHRGAILVDDELRTSEQDVYAVGDGILVRQFITNKPAYIPLAGPANKQGRIVADNICGGSSTYKGTQGSSILKVFHMTVASTGLCEQTARDAGYQYDKIYNYSPSHATYYPGASNISIKTLFETGTGKILGAQLVGFDGVDKRCDVLATAIRAGLSVKDLAELELCYAPPYSSAKDPVNMIGFVAENILTGKVRQCHVEDIPAIQKDDGAIFLDVRTDGEYRDGHIPGAVHIPLESLRDHLEKLDRRKRVYVNCQSGLRSYIACRILTQNGFDCYNLSGGYRLYDSVFRDNDDMTAGAFPCGKNK